MTRSALLVLAVAATGSLGDSSSEADGTLLPPPKSRQFSYQPLAARRGIETSSWRVLAGWAAVGKGSAPIVHSPDDLVGVALEFGTGKRPVPTDRFLASASEPDPEGLRIRIDSRLSDREPNLPRQALRFFWRPGCASQPRFEVLPGSPASRSERQEGYTAFSHGGLIPGDQQSARGMAAFRDLLDRIGKAGTGRVFWMVEPNDPDPAHVVVGWLPEGVSWARAEVASPVWPNAFKLAVFEPPPEWVSPAKAGEIYGVRRPVRTGLVALEPGTWKILEQCRHERTKLVALGREGVVLDADDDAHPQRRVYSVYLRRQFADGVRYDQPLMTRGLGPRGDPPPQWAQRFGLKASWSHDEAEHLVGLAVCSQAVWAKRRGRGAHPAEHLRPLFMDPELWACPAAR